MPSMHNREECAPKGVILQGSIGPMSTRINTWCAHYGQTIIVDGKRTRRLARAAAWAWYDSTTEEHRAEMLRLDKVKEQQNTLRRAALIIKEYGAEADYPLSDAVSAFADDIR